MLLCLLLLACLLLACWADLPPHRTVVDIRRVPRTPSFDPSKPNITIGFLSDFKDIGKLIAGAIPLAVRLVNDDPLLLPDHNLLFVYQDSGRDNPALGVRLMTRMRERQRVAAFIGPDHGCAAEALVAAAWEMPMITYKCRDRTVSDKSVFSTFARTLPPSSKASKSIVALLLHFEWRRIALVAARTPSDGQTADALRYLAARHGIDVVGTFHIPGDYLTKDSATLQNIVMVTYARTRVYVVIADYNALVDLVRFMQEKGLFDSGEYVVISLDEDEVYDPNKEHQYIRRTFEAYKMAADPKPFRSVLLLSPGSPIHPDYGYFQDLVLNYSSSEPFNIPFHPFLRVEIPIYAGLAYDAVMIYSSALTQALAHNKSERDGTEVFQFIKSRSYESILGFSVMIDDQGDAEGNYTVMALDPDDQRMRPVARFIQQGGNDLPILRLERQIHWISGSPPLSEPRCGFSGEKCDAGPELRMTIIYASCCAVALVAAIFIFRHYRYEHKLACLLWKVEMKDLVMLRSDHDVACTRFQHNLNELDTRRSQKKEGSLPLTEDPVTGRTQSRVGFYKGNAVYIHHVYKKSVDLTRNLRKEMIQIREMRHENINPFIGACVDPPNICILTLFCARGSLQDVLENTDLHLDNMFIASLVADLVKGMIYIHESELVSHGNLKSGNCLVDSRWVLKVADFGLHEFRAGQDPPRRVQQQRDRSLLWRAPELLRDPSPPPRGTQKGDVYSFGVILFEIMGRRGPWGRPEPEPHYVAERVCQPELSYRPPSHELENCPDYIRQCMEQCWNEDPEDRPDFRFVKVRLKLLHSGLNTNIFDNMMNIMEKYAYNLESVVKERTNQLLEEKKKTENLLLRMLPKPVAEQLLRGEKVEAESFDSVTIYFSDIVGFTSLSAVSTPLQVVDLLNDLYTCFDSIIGHFDVYKVETIGDAYMVVSGLPLRNGLRHAGEVASLALRLREAMEAFEIRHRPGERLALRIGVNSGPCVAGVVGLKMPRYCLFGDTVNTASRMESSGEAMKIHLSEACKEILDKLGGYIVKERGLVQIKGKGEMRTYWLVGKETSDTESLPDSTIAEDSRVSFCDGFIKELGSPRRNASIKRDRGSRRSAPVISYKEFYNPEDCAF